MDEVAVLKSLMESSKLRVIDVASAFKVSPNTVKKFLDRGRMNRAVRDHIAQKTRELADSTLTRKVV
jgi:predicted ArsR family transcriptional regulator